MLDLFNLPSNSQANIQLFTGSSTSADPSWQIWTKPRGKTMAYIICQGCGGDGGAGVIGANSTAAGGGGGGSGAKANLIIPLWFLPDVLFVTVPAPGAGTTLFTKVCIAPIGNTIGNNIVLAARGGSNGGNAAGATAGAAGAAGVITAITDNSIAGYGIAFFLVGLAGIIGGTTVSAGNFSFPNTGQIALPGTGGGGLPAAAATGTNGGTYASIPAAPSLYPQVTQALGSATATVPAANGSQGFSDFQGLKYWYGGQGGASTHGTATGAGLQQSSGGNGSIGSGGGGSGGALTGSAAGVPGKGGPGLAAIICW